MKKILYLLVLFTLLFGAVSPVGAAPLRSDPLLVCDLVTGGECLESTGNYIKASFYHMAGNTSVKLDMHSTAPILDKKMSVRWTVTGVETSSFSSNTAGLSFRITPALGGNYIVNHTYGTGTSVNTSETWTVIDHTFTSSNAQNFDVSVLHTRTWPTNASSYIEGFIEVWVGDYPLDCDEYSTVSTDEFEIDPTIEDPLGPAGSPPDDQIYPTEIASVYEVMILGEGWNDGTDDRTDAVYSWDGVEWLPFVASCTGAAAGVYYIPALSETFYIRANDVTTEFADNTQVNALDPFSYSIGLAILPSSCESQFTFNPEDDLIAEVVINGNDEDGEQSTGTTGFSPLPEMVPTEWYAITVTSGAWKDEGAGPDRTDMEYQVTHNTGFDTANYVDLDDGSDGVWCQSTDETTWYIQARSTDLYLRVNNITGTFTGNTGALNVSIYHAAFERSLEACEFNYDEYQAPSRQEVSGNASSGKTFAYVGGEDDPFAGLQGGAGAGDDPFDVESDSWSVVRLVPGAWYIIETIEGPWIENTSQPNDYRYDMAVNDGSGWVNLADWIVPECNVASDALGHRRIYFQIPTGEELEWLFRVNSTTFSNNGGYLAWNIYRAVEVDFTNPAFNPWAGCIDNAQSSYDVLAFSSFIPVKFEEGTYVKGNINTGVGLNGVTTVTNEAEILSVGMTYVIQIAGGPWDDDDTDAVLGDRYDAAISSDNGVTWFPLDAETPGADCISDDQQGRYFSFKFTVADGEIWKIRVNDNTGDFQNNGGNLTYHLYQIRNFYGAESGAGANPTTLCTGGIPTPAPPTSLIDIPAWLGYVAGWVDYSAMTIRRFFSLCPQHINSVMAVIGRLRTLEPLASVAEALSVIDDIRIEIASYDWGGNPQSTSIFDVDSAADVNEIVNDRIFPTSSDARSPWEGGDIIDTSDFTGGGWSPGSYYSTCLSAFDGYLPTAVAQGVCFVSAAFRDTGASFWIQLSFDVSCIFMMVAVTKRPLQEVIYMMTGVRPWTRSGAESGLNKLIGYLERRDGKADLDAQELSNRFGGSFYRDRDGSFRRRQ